MKLSDIFEAVIPFPNPKPSPDEETKAFLARPVNELTLVDTLRELKKARESWNGKSSNTNLDLAQHHQRHGNARLVARYLQRFYGKLNESIVYRSRCGTGSARN